LKGIQHKQSKNPTKKPSQKTSPKNLQKTPHKKAHRRNPRIREWPPIPLSLKKRISPNKKVSANADPTTKKTWLKSNVISSQTFPSKKLITQKNPHKFS